MKLPKQYTKDDFSHVYNNEWTGDQKQQYVILDLACRAILAQTGDLTKQNITDATKTSKYSEEFLHCVDILYNRFKDLSPEDAVPVK